MGIHRSSKIATYSFFSKRPARAAIVVLLIKKRRYVSDVMIVEGLISIVVVKVWVLVGGSDVHRNVL